MSDFLSHDIRSEMEAARKRDLRRRSRLRVQTDLNSYPVLRTFADGFTLDADQVTRLRGIVDLYDGARHLSQCLIMASDVAGGELICTMKWQTAAGTHAALDYVRDEAAPVGYLPHQ